MMIVHWEEVLANGGGHSIKHNLTENDGGGGGGGGCGVHEAKAVNGSRFGGITYDRRHSTDQSEHQKIIGEDYQ